MNDRKSRRHFIRLDLFSRAWLANRPLCHADSFGDRLAALHGDELAAVGHDGRFDGPKRCDQHRHLLALRFDPVSHDRSSTDYGR